jgi:hypothetical protein
VVVVPAGAHEQCRPTELGGDVEPERVDVEGARRAHVSHRQVDVTDGCRVGGCRPCSRGIRQVVPDEGVRVEVQGRHLDLTMGPRPVAAVTIPVELDAVAFGVGCVERLADEVVGAAGEGLGRVLGEGEQRGGQRGLRLEEDRGVEQARSTCGRVA